MLNYLRQVDVCKSVIKMINQALSQTDDAGVRLKATNIPTTESILRAVSLLPNIDTEEKLKDFIIEHISNSLFLTPIQREHLNLNN